MQTRDEQILKHVALHRLSIRAAIEHLYFEGRSCDDVLNRLVTQEQLLTVHKLPNRLSYYRLSLPAAHKLGITKNRARPVGVQARSIRRALSVLWFCCMGDKRKYRIERRQLVAMFGRIPALGIPHCWEPLDEQKKLIHRVYTPGPNTAPDAIARTIKADSEEAIADPKLGELILNRRFVFSVLVENLERKMIVARQISGGSAAQVPVSVHQVPSVSDLALAVRAHRKEKGYEPAD